MSDSTGRADDTAAALQDHPAFAGHQTLEDGLAEARRLIGLADAAGLTVRLIGGVAFHARLPALSGLTDRPRRDIDLATRSQDRRALTVLLAGEGYDADRQFNALHGHKQLYFVDRRRGRPLDVLIDRLEMCHRFEFGARLALERETLPLAELLLSKLQIVSMDPKDMSDTLALLAFYDLAETDDGAINVRKIVELTATGWGWWRTVTRNLARLAAFDRDDDRWRGLGIAAPHDVQRQLAALCEAIGTARKSSRWRLRAIVGERIPWYDEPEVVEHDDL